MISVTWKQFIVAHPLSLYLDFRRSVSFVRAEAVVTPYDAIQLKPPHLTDDACDPQFRQQQPGYLSHNGCQDKLDKRVKEEWAPIQSVG
jgi:hypothetical protein